MSLAINPDHITAVILKDGTRIDVVPKSAIIDTYEYVERTMDERGFIYSSPPEHDPTASSVGMEVINLETGWVMSFPLSSILAVQLDYRDE